MLRKILLCALLAMPVAGICQKSGKKPKPAPAAADIDYRVPGSPMPPLRIVTKERKSISTATVANDANLIVMMFNPTCGHCEEMENNIALFRKTHIVLVASAGMFEYLDYFQKNVKAEQYPSLKIGVDSAQFIDKAFNYEGLPQVNVYDKQRRLIKSFNKITTIDSIRQYIQ
jgi:thiol-disulfide isomerase/thioredoxin